MKWPEPSSDLFDKTMARIEESEDVRSKQSFIFILINRPAFLSVCFLVFLCLGMSSGIQYSDQDETLQNQSDFQYFSVGPSYAYGADLGGRYE